MEDKSCPSQTSQQFIKSAGRNACIAPQVGTIYVGMVIDNVGGVWPVFLFQGKGLIKIRTTY